MDTTNLPHPKGVIDGGAIARGSRTLFQILKSRISGKLELSTQEEADSRAKICLNCPWKVTMRHSCGGPCGEIVGIISGTADKETNPPLGQLSCGICQCFLRSAVWIPLDLQCGSLEDSVKAQFAQVQTAYPCWKRC